ncbi:MAG: CDP-alcohol phosphatidyltransferase family protein [Gemmatimonadales bacterium]
MFDDLLRAFKDRLLAPAARALGPSCPPAVVTLCALAAGVAAAWLAAERSYAWALAAWLANRVLDGLDGAVARVHGRASDLGGYFDILCDFAVYALVPIGLVAGAPTAEGWRALAILLAAFYLNAASWLYLAAVLERRGRGAAVSGQLTSVAMPAGLIAGTETIVFYTLFLLLPAQAVPLFLAMAALVLVGVTQRAVWAGRTL